MIDAIVYCEPYTHIKLIHAGIIETSDYIIKIKKIENKICVQCDLCRNF